MGRRLREALKIGLLLMLLSQFCSNVFAQQHHDIAFSRDLGLVETFSVNAEYFSKNIPLTEAFRETSLYLAERFVFTDFFNLILYEFYAIPFTELVSLDETFILRSFPAFLMGLSIGDDIGVSYTPLLDDMSFSESVRESIERVKAVGGMIISQVPLKNFVTFLALLIGFIGLLFIMQGIKARNDR